VDRIRYTVVLIDDEKHYSSSVSLETCVGWFFLHLQIGAGQHGGDMLLGTANRGLWDTRRSFSICHYHKPFIKTLTIVL